VIPVAKWSKAPVFSHTIAGIVGLNHTEDMDVCLAFVVCCVYNVLCDGLITCSEESYGVCACMCVCVCVISKSKCGSPDTSWSVAPQSTVHK